MLFTTTLLVVRNQRILHAWNARQEENQRRAATGPAPENPQTAPQDPRRPRRRAALTRNRHDHEPRARHHHQDSRHNQAKARPDTGQTSGTRPRRGTRRPQHRTTGYQQAGMSDPNVKIGLTET